MKFYEGSGVVDSIFGKSQAPIRMFLESRGEAYEQKSIAKELFLMEKSSNYAEKVTGMTAFDGFQPVGENGEYPNDEAQEGYSKTFEHVTWKDKFALSREIIDDGKVMDLRKRPEGFVKGFYRTRENFAAALIGAASQGSTSVTFGGRAFDTKCADGACLFSTSHGAKVKGSAQSNMFSDAFSASALGKAEAAMQNFKGDNKEILDVAPTIILIPNVAALKKAVFEAIGSHDDPTSANNAFNYQFGRWEVITWPYLNQFIGSTNTAPWFLFDKEYNDTYGGNVWFDRVELEIKSEIASNDANEWKGYARWSAGFADWRQICGGGLSGGSSL